MLRHRPVIRYRLAAMLATHWWDFVSSYGRWIRPVVFDNVRKVLACRTPVLGCHVYKCAKCDHLQLIPHSCKSRFCPTCGKRATDAWADGVLSQLLDVPYHHLVLSTPWQLRTLLAMNRVEGLNILVRSAVEAVQQWARDVKEMRLGIIAVIHTFGSDLKWHPLVCPRCDVPLTFLGMVFGSWGDIEEVFIRANSPRRIPVALLKPG